MLINVAKHFFRPMSQRHKKFQRWELDKPVYPVNCEQSDHFNFIQTTVIHMGGYPAGKKW